MERFQGVSEVSATVQATLGMIASYMERVKKYVKSCEIGLLF